MIHFEDSLHVNVGVDTCGGTFSKLDYFWNLNVTIYGLLTAFLDGSTLQLFFDLYRELPPTLSPMVSDRGINRWQNNDLHSFFACDVSPC